MTSSALVLVPGPVEPAGVLRHRSRRGELVRVVDDVYLPADLGAWPVARCGALRELSSSGWVAGLAAAVWARGGPGRSPAGPPHGHGDGHEVELLAPRSARVRVRDGVRVRLVPVAPADVTVVHGARVTAPVRTAADLLLWGTGRDDAALAWLWAHGVDPGEAVDHLVARGPVPGLTRAAVAVRAVRAGDPAPLARHPPP